jgi:hypothetical protein
MREGEAGRVEAIAVAILDHMRTRPSAADSADGVARWWLGLEPASATLEQVERALDLLVARHAIHRLKLMDGTLLYSQPAPVRQRVATEPITMTERTTRSQRCQ